MKFTIRFWQEWSQLWQVKKSIWIEFHLIDVTIERYHYHGHGLEVWIILLGLGVVVDCQWQSSPLL